MLVKKSLSMNNFFVKKTIHFFLLVLSVYLLSFFLVRLIPGDPVDILAGIGNSSVDVALIKQQLGLEQSFFGQLKTAIKNLLLFDFGFSIHQGSSVNDIIKPALLNTYILALTAVIISILIGIPLGLFVSLTNKNEFINIVKKICNIIIAIPSFILAPILILVFSMQLNWLPVSGMDSHLSIVLPSLTLALGLLCYLANMTLDCANDLKENAIITTARSKGLRIEKIYFIHILRLISLPLVTAIGMQLGGLLSGAIITEMIFSWDGVGKILIDSIHQRDYPITQAAIFFIAITFVAINFILEFIYRKLDPRIR